MGKPIADFIMEHLVNALAGVTATSVDAGVTFIVNEPDAIADSPQDSIVLVKEGNWTYEDPSPIGFDGIFQDYEVIFYVEDGGVDSTYHARCRAYAAAGKRAIMADEQRGGYARWTKVTGARKFEGETRGVVLDVQVYFRTVMDQPDRLS